MKVLGSTVVFFWPTKQGSWDPTDRSGPARQPANEQRTGHGKPSCKVTSTYNDHYLLQSHHHPTLLFGYRFSARRNATPPKTRVRVPTLSTTLVCPNHPNQSHLDICVIRYLQQGHLGHHNVILSPIRVSLRAVPERRSCLPGSSTVSQL